jgi:hypothetical protein
MTATEFIEGLTKIRASFDWKLVRDTSWTPDRRTQPRFQIRATGRDPRAKYFEPIGALCYTRTGITYSPDSWRDAARTLNFSDADAWQIVAASNDLTWHPVGPDKLRGPDPQIESLRTQLESALGLESAQASAR